MALRNINLNFCVRINECLHTKVYILFDLLQLRCFIFQRQILVWATPYITVIHPMYLRYANICGLPIWFVYIAANSSFSLHRHVFVTSVENRTYIKLLVIAGSRAGTKFYQMAILRFFASQGQLLTDYREIWHIWGFAD